KPYYLFQGDLAAGTSHFRVPLDRGIDLVRQLRRRISGLAMPVYAVDLPEGGGKIPISENYLDELVDDETGKKYRFTGPDGRPYYYPLERQ
ncbi:MAG: KamA family radical SAM protein, partial [Spirochaetota bacterium]|nr:KamA family radical SAM protein [Spirochaetota bacterium]